MKNNHLTILALVLIISTLIQSSYVIIKVYEVKQIPIAAKATSSSAGIISFCISGIPPENITTTCINRTREGVESSCSVNASDPDGGNMTFSITGGEGSVTTSSDGEVTIKTYIGALESPPLFEKYGDFLGNHTINFIVTQTGACGDIQTILHHKLEVYDENDAPVQIQTVPDIVIPVSQQVALYGLNDYFYDPERQSLSYSESGSSSILLTILGSGDVLALSTACVAEDVTFTVTDLGNLSINSNTVTISVDCGEASQGAGGTEEGGGDGGGGMGSISCTSDWQCDPWTDCTSYGTRTRTCIDMNACNPDYFIHEVEEECEYIPRPNCEELWECLDWDACAPSNTQTRECTELSGCGTEENKPPTVQGCVYIPTCSDSIQNQGETGVDCGGPCLPCKILEIPGALKDEKTILSSLMLLLILILLSLLITYKYFHKQINGAIVKVLLTVTKRRAKRILLSEKDKKFLLNSLLDIEKNITKKNLNKKIMDTTVVCRQYFSRIFMISLSLSIEQLEEYIKQLKIKEPLNNIFFSFYDKIVALETEKLKIHKTGLLIMIEELREIIHLTSRFKKEDVGKEVKEIPIEKSDKKIVKIKKHIYNTYIAMHFDKLEISKNKYSEIINLYENLLEKEKGKIYSDIERLFNEIKYLISILI